MSSAKSILAILFFFGSLGGVTPSFGFEDGSSVTTQARTSLRDLRNGRKQPAERKPSCE
jgi:hypothetical protein